MKGLWLQTNGFEPVADKGAMATLHKLKPVPDDGPDEGPMSTFHNLEPVADDWPVAAILEVCLPCG